MREQYAKNKLYAGTSEYPPLPQGDNVCGADNQQGSLMISSNPSETTRLTPVKSALRSDEVAISLGDDIVRSSWRHEEASRNVLPAYSSEYEVTLEPKK